MRSKKIFNRMMFAFIILIAILLVIGIVGIIGITSIDADLEYVFNSSVTGIQYVGEVRANFITAAVNTTRLVLEGYAGNRDLVEASKSAFDDALRELEKYATLYKQIVEKEEAIAIVNQLDTLMGEYFALSNELYTLALTAATTGNTSEMRARYEVGAPIRVRIDDGMSELMTLNVSYAEEVNQSSTTQANLLLWIQILFLVGGIAAAVILGFVIATAIEKDLKSVITKLTESSSVIDAAASQLMEASESLANGSSEQAASIEETSATMNESASMIKQTTENTRQAAQLAKATNEVAEEGRQKMAKMVEVMENIKESSDMMNRTIKIINDIAFQTNLLAINATVEAARAGGESGRSFGVVAGEVRNLAQNSAKSAENTSEAIEKNILLSNQGREASREVSEVLHTITSDADELSKLISEINAASEEQTGGISQINTAISQMEKVTQQNAAVSEENAASSASLKDEIASLREAVGIAEQLLRTPNSTQESNAGRLAAPSNLAAQRKPQTYTPPKSVPNTNVKTTTQRNSSANNEKNPEKIIPLDDDDNF